ncbi:MAG: fatty acid desaturase family protein [Bacillota bacterium]
MTELRTMGWYAQQIAPLLPPQAFKPVPARLWGGLVYLGLAVGSIITIGLYDLHPLINLGLSLIIGQSFAGLGFLGHEILHGTVIKNAWLRDFLGSVAFAQFSLGPKLWRKWHNMEHHAHTQEEDTDPDAMGTLERFYQRPLLQWLYRVHPNVRATITFASFLLFFSVFCLLMLRRYYREFRPQERPVVLAQMLWPFAMWFVLLLLLGPGKWLFAYLLPLMLANFLVISYISTNHQLSPLTDVNDPLANSLSVTVPRWMDVLHFNFSHHVEHHVFPGMSPKYAPLVKAELKRLFPRQYQEMAFSAALAALWRTPRIYKDHVDLVDPVRGVAYGTLGNELDLQGRKVPLAEVSHFVPPPREAAPSRR